MAQRHKGRRSLGLEAYIWCEECGARWTPNQATIDAIQLALDYLAADQATRDTIRRLLPASDDAVDAAA